MSEKDGHTVSSHATTSNDHKETDQALVFLKQVGAPTEEGREDLQRIRRKVDWNIIPILFVCYTLQFIDKVALNYGAVMGLPKDLHLKGNDFSNAGTAFFIAYLIAEIPNAMALNKVPAGKWLGINVALWGIATACTAAAHNYHTLLVARIFLGIFEAAIAPSLMMISSQWYNKSEQAPRFSLWYTGLGVGQIVGGALSFGFQHVTSKTLPGWKLLFIVLGVFTFVVGIITFFVVPDSPMTARFLNDQQKAALLQHISVNKTGVRSKEVTLSHVKEALFDVQLWLMTIMTICISVSSGVITTYSATVIRNFGYTPKKSALLNMPGGVISIFSTLLVGYGVRYTSNRWAWLVACCIPGIIGGALMSFLPKHNHSGLLAGIYMVNFVVATLAVIYQWTAANVAGTTKRAFSLALISGSFSVGNIIGPQTFQAKDAPQYIPAKIAVLATQAAGALVAIVLFAYYVWENKRRDQAEQVQGEKTDAASVNSEGDWANLTDRENKSFRYVY